jgi:hypothetical protein
MLISGKKLPQEEIAAMVNRATFDLDQFQIHISSKLSSTTISLWLLDNGNSDPQSYFISGFPRKLVLENTPRGQLSENPSCLSQLNQR